MGLKKKYKKLKKKNLELWTKLEHAAKLLAEAALEIAALRRQVPPVKGKHTERDLTMVIDEPKEPEPHTFGVYAGYKAHPDNPSCFIRDPDFNANKTFAVITTVGSSGKKHVTEIHAPNGVEAYQVSKSLKSSGPGGLTIPSNVVMDAK